MSGFERERDRGLCACATRDLSEQGGIGRLSLQQAPEIEELDQAERETVLEARVERKLHEQILARGHPLHEAGARAAASPDGVEVERKEPRAGADRPMKLHDRTRHGVQEPTSMVGLFLLGQAGCLQQRDRAGPIVEHEQVHVRHGTMGHGIVQALGERGSFERQTAHPSSPEELLDPARHVELAHPERKGLVVGPAEGQSSSIWPTGALLSNGLMEKPSQTLLPRDFHKQAGPPFVGSGGQLTGGEPPPQELPCNRPVYLKSCACGRYEVPSHVSCTSSFRGFRCWHCSWFLGNIAWMQCRGCRMADSRWPPAPT